MNCMVFEVYQKIHFSFLPPGPKSGIHRTRMSICQSTSLYFTFAVMAYSFQQTRFWCPVAVLGLELTATLRQNLSRVITFCSSDALNVSGSTVTLDEKRRGVRTGHLATLQFLLAVNLLIVNLRSKMNQKHWLLSFAFSKWPFTRRHSNSIVLSNGCPLIN